MPEGTNIHHDTVEGFGDEWSRFDQSGLSATERAGIFAGYFSLFPWHELPEDAVGFDLGCGSGRWAQLVAPRVGRLHCIDPSVALDVARRNLAANPNCVFHLASVDAIPLDDGSMDFGYSLGVLHHVPTLRPGSMRRCRS
jgi:SAM-dependent methyltransferase